MAKLIKESIDETAANGFIQYTVTQVYLVLSDSRTTGPGDVLTTAGIPARGASALIGGTSIYVWCTKRNATRVDEEATAKKWHVTCTYTNHTQEFPRNAAGLPVSEPTEAVKTVEESYLEYSEPIDDATLRSITQNGPESSPSAITVSTPFWLGGGRVGPITNSAGEPILVEKIKYRKRIVVSRFVDSWDSSWDSFKGVINSDTVTITQTDSQGVKDTSTYAPRTLLMEPPQKQPVWQDAKLLFKVSFVMEYNEATWTHSELDRGTKRRIHVNQYKMDGEQYDQTDLDEKQIEGEFALEDILTNNNTSAIGSPIRFNGYGAEIPTPSAASYDEETAFYLNFNKFEEKAFSPLNL